ncbi:MAG: glycosyltransferase family 39 protein [Anaerolineae bacterium]|nr:glycosyltransferase family 39 protein [Anaerolineae bacterium]
MRRPDADLSICSPRPRSTGAQPGLAVLLLAVNPSFVFWSRQGILVTNVTVTLFCASLWTAWRWQQTRQARWLWLTGFLWGLGLWAKLLFIWAIGAMLVIAALGWLRRGAFRPWGVAHEGGLRSRYSDVSRRTAVRQWVGFGLAFLAGVWPLLHFNLQTGGTVTSILGNLNTSLRRQQHPFCGQPGQTHRTDRHPPARASLLVPGRGVRQSGRAVGVGRPAGSRDPTWAGGLPGVRGAQAGSGGSAGRPGCSASVRRPRSLAPRAGFDAAGRAHRRAEPLPPFQICSSRILRCCCRCCPCCATRPTCWRSTVAGLRCWRSLRCWFGAASMPGIPCATTPSSPPAAVTQPILTPPIA